MVPMKTTAAATRAMRTRRLRTKKKTLRLPAEAEAAVAADQLMVAAAAAGDPRQLLAAALGNACRSQSALSRPCRHGLRRSTPSTRVTAASGQSTRCLRRWQSRCGLSVASLHRGGTASLLAAVCQLHPRPRAAPPLAGHRHRLAVGEDQGRHHENPPRGAAVPRPQVPRCEAAAPEGRAAPSGCRCFTASGCRSLTEGEVEACAALYPGACCGRAGRRLPSSTDTPAWTCGRAGVSSRVSSGAFAGRDAAGSECWAHRRALPATRARRPSAPVSGCQRGRGRLLFPARASLAPGVCSRGCRGPPDRPAVRPCGRGRTATPPGRSGSFEHVCRSSCHCCGRRCCRVFAGGWATCVACSSR